MGCKHDVPKWVRCEECYPIKKAKSKSPSVTGLSDAERDMDMIFCLAIARTFPFGSIESINLLEEYRELMTQKEEMLKKIKGT
jgi:hypothetical protein